MTHASVKFPHRIEVLRLVESRYGSGDWHERPTSWDERVGGIDICESVEGDTLRLLSSPMQSPPKSGWILMLTGGDSNQGYSWTLYGMGRSQ
jgi:hypothetical protein